jgi:hypothetical protein
MSHDDQDMMAPTRASFIAVLPLLLNSSFTPPNIYISAPSKITPRLIYPTNERRVSATLIMIQGILSNPMFPVRKSFELTQPLHSKIDFCARLICVAKRKRRAIIRIREK